MSKILGMRLCTPCKSALDNLNSDLGLYPIECTGIMMIPTPWEVSSMCDSRDLEGFRNSHINEARPRRVTYSALLLHRARVPALCRLVVWRSDARSCPGWRSNRGVWAAPCRPPAARCAAPRPWGCTDLGAAAPRWRPRTPAGAPRHCPLRGPHLSGCWTIKASWDPRQSVEGRRALGSGLVPHHWGCAARCHHRRVSAAPFPPPSRSC